MTIRYVRSLKDLLDGKIETSSIIREEQEKLNEISDQETRICQEAFGWTPEILEKMSRVEELSLRLPEIRVELTRKSEASGKRIAIEGIDFPVLRGLKS